MRLPARGEARLGAVEVAALDGFTSLAVRALPCAALTVGPIEGLATPRTRGHRGVHLLGSAVLQLSRNVDPRRDVPVSVFGGLG